MAAQIPLETTSSSDDHDLLAQIPTNFTNDFQSFAGNSPTAISESGLSVRFTQGLRGRKRRKNDEKEEILKKPKEVIHVRAKRGQATDSHSLAERVRREKINERLRCLQNLVPGCYKKMGMAVMLDVIINYIRSLQNQIEFLSMELSAASMHGNNLERNTLEAVQGTDADEFQEIERMIKEGYGGPTYSQSKWPL